MSATVPARVLIVDDEPNVATIFAEGLKRVHEALTVDTANSGQAALEMINQHTYGLLITDYRMPGMSGIELIQRVRAQSPATRIILMTAYGTEALQGVMGSLKVDGYLDKPVSMAEVREIVGVIIGRTQQALAPPPPVPEAVHDEIHACLDSLQRNTGARCVVLASASGYPIDLAGVTDDLDVGSISALVSANFMAVIELARLLGNESVFRSSYHEGPGYDIYAFAVNKDCLLVVIFGEESKPGLVRFYTRSTADTLVPMLARLPEAQISGMPMIEAIEAELNELFSGSL